MKKYLALLATMVAVTAVVFAGSALAGKGGTDRPFNGAGSGTTQVLGVSGNVVTTSSAGSYVGSHLGNGTYTIDATQTYFNLTQADNAGEFTFVAANGDTLVGSVGGTTEEITYLVEYHSALVVTLTGGTGRFEGATGSITISGVSTGPGDGTYIDTFSWSGLLSK